MIYQLTITGEVEIVGVFEDTDKRYSPLWFMDAVREAHQCDRFDLDPCSDVIGNQNVRADKIYTIQDDGLEQPFYGNMYCNWPFSNPRPWMQRIIDFDADIEQITVLARCDLSTRWARMALDYFDLACHPRKRISFDGCDDAPDFTCIVFYKGPNRDYWAKVMDEKVGAVFSRVSSGSHSSDLIQPPSGALFSECRTWRYGLWRIWDESLPMVAFCGLNPSTADEENNDPTVRRCINFAKSWGFGGMFMLNAYGFRATLPKDMKAAADPVGPDNDKWLAYFAERSEMVIAAWGAHCSFNREAEVYELLKPNVYCLGTTKAGHPKHPLYLSASTERVPWQSATVAQAIC
ncbi:DNA N-6-adenine-methyltransferase [Nodosilinea nodulosa]|uniref:DNA N-6-adenine-methyltransferase n=1 Tax=Nodosilinea nodulosa TaxID=416001 RepID=UPI0002D9D87B|nr:DNA N-6-adenine-methyltransferase [Nodosilinea nodulosa]